MGVAALILGIISLVIGFIPLCGAIAFMPAIIGLILGIVDIVLKKKKGEKIGMSIAGTVLSAIAVVVITFWVFIFGAAAIVAGDEYNNTVYNYSSSYYSSLYE